MRSNDNPAFKETLAGVYSLYRQDLSTTVVEMWWAALKPYSLSEVRQALARHVADPTIGQFCPKPADVIKTITDTQSQDKGQRCWNCQADISNAGWTALRAGRVCNPCYKAYLNNEWPNEKAA